MTVLVADTSALVSLGIIADRDRSPLDILVESFRVCLPERVRDELRETSSYDDPSGDAADVVLEHESAFDVRSVDLDETFPLDDGENAAVTLANDLDATHFLCDEFNQLALVHASLVDTRLVTTPTFLTMLVRTGDLDESDAVAVLAAMSSARSWDTNAYVARAKDTLERSSETE